MAATIRFSWDNLIWRSGTVFAGGTVDADWPLANLAEYHPSKKTRLTDMTDSYIRVTLPGVIPYDTAAIINHSATPHRNLLQYSSNVIANPTEWPLTNCGINVAGIEVSATSYHTERFDTATVGNVKHYTQNVRTLASYTTNRDSSSGQTFVGEVIFKQWASDRHAGLHIIGTGSNNLVANMNLNTGAMQFLSTAGNWSDEVATITDLGDSYYRVSVAFTIDEDETSLSYRLTALDASFADTFDSSGVVKWFYFAEPSLKRVDASEAYDDTSWSSGGSGGLWRLKRSWVALTPTTATNHSGSVWLNMADSSTPKPLSDGLGSLSCYTVVTPFQGDVSLFEIHNPDNAVTDVDIGALWLGQSWQPTKTLSIGWSPQIDEETGMLNLSGTLSYLTEADFHEDALPLGLNARVGTQASQMSIGGQEFRADSKPILCIIDSDETEHGQQQMIYGFLDQWAGRHAFHAATGGEIFAVDFLVRGLRG